MTPSELRIGNTVIDLNFPTLFSAVEQLHSEYAITSYSDSISYDKLSGIPLTPEILTKRGFIEKGKPYPMKTVLGSHEISLFKNHSIWIYFRNSNLDKVTSGSGSKEHDYIKYLHQLQNLYFALTGTELT